MRKRLLRFYLVICFILISVILSSCSFNFKLNINSINSENLNVHFIDVGQGDCIFIQIPNGETMLIDSGENGLGSEIIDYIEKYGAEKIDYLIATHPHSDHIGSMAYIIDNFEIKSVYMPKVSTNTETFENLLEAVANKNLKIVNAKAGVSIADNETFSADILAPVSIDNNEELNNCSVVIKLNYLDTSFLFTGDAEKSELDTIVGDVSADVLKVGHHGSRTSTYEEFIKKVNPSIAVISVGEDNAYNHPHPEAISILKEYTESIYRTDKDGTVIVSSDGQELSVIKE